MNGYAEKNKRRQSGSRNHFSYCTAGDAATEFRI